MEEVRCNGREWRSPSNGTGNLPIEGVICMLLVVVGIIAIDRSMAGEYWLWIMGSAAEI